MPIKSVLILSATILLSLKFASPALAVIYQPGETLNPACGPTDANCKVIAPASAGGNSDITSLTGLTTPLPVSEGGIGLSSVPTGGLIYGAGSNTFATLAIGTTSQVLTVNGSGQPIWATSPSGTGTTYAAGSGLSLSSNVFSLNLVSSNVWTALQRFTGGIGVTGAANFTNNLTVGGTFVSVGSTNLVTNLNSNYLGGISSSGFLQTGYTGFDNYNHWSLQTNGAGTTNVLTANTVNFINGVGVSLSQFGSAITVNIGQNVGTTASPTFAGLSLTNSSNQLALGGSGTKTTITASVQAANRIVTLPVITADDTFVLNNDGATLTNKTIDANSNTISNLTTSNLSAGASIANTQLANSSVTINTSAGLQGGGAMGLGSSLSLALTFVGTAGTYGSATLVPVLTVDAQGRITGVTPTTITGLTTSNLSATAGITNAQLANSSISINAVAGTGIGISGSPVSLGGSLNISGIDATSTVKGVASFDSNNFLVTSGAVNTIQNIGTGATPIFNSTTLTNRLFITSTTNQLSLGATNTTTISSVSPTSSRIATISGLTTNDTFAFIGQTQTLTNKTIDAASNTISNLTNSNLSGSAGITDANLATITTANKVSGSAVQLNGNGGLANNTGLSMLRTCADNQLLKWTSGGGWACADDNSGGTPTVYSDGGLLSDGTGLSLIRTCSDGQLLKWTSASGWHCDSDIAGGGSMTVKASDNSVSVSPLTVLQFGSTGTSSDEFIVSDLGSSQARIRTGNKVVLTDAAQTLSNKTISAIGNTITSLTNANLLSGSAATTDNNLSTISTANKVSGSAVQLATGGGLINNSGLSLITTCNNGEVLSWDTGSSSWICSGGHSQILSMITAATAANTINNADFAQVWNWSLTTDGKTAFTFGENTASTNGTGTQYILGASTKAGSTAAPLKVVAQNNTIIDTTSSGGITIGSLTAGQGITIDGGVGTLDFGASTNDKNINIGSVTGVSSLTMLVGTGGFSLNGVGSSPYSIGTSTTSGTFTLGGVAQTGTANLFTGNGGMEINIGTGAGANNIVIGNATTTTGIHLHTGTGNIEVEASNGNGIHFKTNTATDDSIRIAAGLNAGTTSFQGTISEADLTATRTWTLQDNSGIVPLATTGNGIFFTTSGNTTLTLPTSGTVTALGNSTTGSGSTLVLSTTPTFNTSIITPLVIGGALDNNTLTLSGNNATSGNTSTNPNINFNVGDSGATTAMTILNNGYIGIGTTAPVGPLEIVVQDDFLTISKYSNDTFSPGVVGRKARGTMASPLAVQTDDKLGSLGGRGYDGTSFPLGVLNSSGLFAVVAGENFTSTNKGTYLSFSVTPLGSTTRNEAMRIDTTGGLQLFKTTNQLSLGATNASTTISATAPSANRIATIPGLTTNDTFAFVGQTQTFTSLQTFTNSIGVSGNSTFTNNLTIGGTFVSIGSTNTVTNLSANYLNGIASSGFLQIGQTGVISIGTGAANNTINIGTTFNGSTTNITSGTGNVNFNVGGNNVSGKVVVGNSGTTTPDLLVLDNGTTDPAGTNGAMYYNTSLNKFRCFQNSAWANCIGAGSDLQHTATYPLTDTNIPIGTGATTTVSSVSITPATATGDVYIRASVFAISGSNTDQVLNMYLANGTCAIGTTIASNLTAISVASGVIAGPLDISAVLTNPGTSALTVSLCAYTTGQTTNVRFIQMTADVIDTGADLAEIYTSNDNSLEPGDVVSFDSNLSAGMQKSQNAYDSTAFGVITTNPGIVIGNVEVEGTKALPVALSGRVPVKVNTENGPINAGDYLTSSSTPGVAMKATKAGTIIGQAMTSYDGQSVGKVMAFIKNGSFNGVKTAQNLTSNDILASLIQQNSQIVPATINLSEINTDKAIAGVEMISPKITTQDLIATNASISGTLTANNINAGSINGLNQIIDQKINDLIGSIKIASGSMTVKDFEASGSAKFIGSAEFHGPAIFKTIAEFMDKTIFHNRVIFADKDMGGYAVIKESTSEVEVKFDKPYEQIPVVNASLVYEGTDSPTFADQGKSYIVAYLNRDGFKLIIPTIAARDFKYHWTALFIKDAKTSQTDSVVSPALVEPIPTLKPTVEPSPTVKPTLIPTPTEIIDITPTPQI